MLRQGVAPCARTPGAQMRARPGIESERAESRAGFVARVRRFRPASGGGQSGPLHGRRLQRRATRFVGVGPALLGFRLAPVSAGAALPSGSPHRIPHRGTALVGDAPGVSSSMATTPPTSARFPAVGIPRTGPISRPRPSLRSAAERRSPRDAIGQRADETI